jgi:hypothetical protein
VPGQRLYFTNQQLRNSDGLALIARSNGDLSLVDPQQRLLWQTTAKDAAHPDRDATFVEIQSDCALVIYHLSYYLLSYDEEKTFLLWTSNPDKHNLGVQC